LWSRRLIWLAAAALVVALVRNGWDARQHHERLRALQCNQPIFNFGRGFQGRVVEHTFHVVNLSRQPVQIEHVTASCGCTTVAKQLEGTIIEPQGNFDIPVRLDLGNSPLGEIERPIMVMFAGEPKLQLTVKLKGTVEAEWTWSPQQVVFEDLGPEVVASRTVTLTQHPEAPPAELGHIAAPAPLTSAIARAGENDSRDWTLTLTTTPPIPAGRRDLTVYAFRTDSSAMIGPIRVTLIGPDAGAQP
jgi:hypothetical protein